MADSPPICFVVLQAMITDTGKDDDFFSAQMKWKKPWKKVLYEDQGVPDNYVDKSFLEEMKKNCEYYTLCCLLAWFIVWYLSFVIISFIYDKLHLVEPEKSVNNKFIGWGFVISRIIKVVEGVISRNRRLRLITLTETLIILDITKTKSNSCYIIHWTKI